ncbi:hypothetical protein Zmor_012317 [Zophobas morio]|jgi:hypothetical protein|uniref:Uncharacterized protein n=1 Tax=Zophobas morio TaxID=2755281 RepID=A0AA38LZP7_9CUCU|nr:hypothetical protein Zmor_012317 [Zophobas morio]
MEREVVHLNVTEFGESLSPPKQLSLDSAHDLVTPHEQLGFYKDENITVVPLILAPLSNTLNENIVYTTPLEERRMHLSHLLDPTRSSLQEAAVLPNAARRQCHSFEKRVSKIFSPSTVVPFNGSLPSLCYIVKTKSHRGNLDNSKADALSIPRGGLLP